MLQNNNLSVESSRNKLHLSKSYIIAINVCFCSSYLQGVFPPSSFDELNLKGWWYGAVEYQVKHNCVKCIYIRLIILLVSAFRVS